MRSDYPRLGLPRGASSAASSAALATQAHRAASRRRHQAQTIAVVVLPGQPGDASDVVIRRGCTLAKMCQRQNAQCGSVWKWPRGSRGPRRARGLRRSRQSQRSTSVACNPAYARRVPSAILRQRWRCYCVGDHAAFARTVMQRNWRCGAPLRVGASSMQAVLGNRKPRHAPVRRHKEPSAMVGLEKIGIR